MATVVEFAQIAIKAELSAVHRVSPTEVKAIRMLRGNELRLAVERQKFFDCLDELKCGEALHRLFWIHKNDIVFWVNLKGSIIASCNNYRRLSMAAALLQASTKSSLKESSVVVPGLLAFLGKHAL